MWQGWSRVPVQTWWRGRAQSRRRCGRSRYVAGKRPSEEQSERLEARRGILEQQLKQVRARVPSRRKRVLIRRTRGPIVSIVSMVAARLRISELQRLTVPHSRQPSAAQSPAPAISIEGCGHAIMKGPGRIGSALLSSCWKSCTAIMRGSSRSSARRISHRRGARCRPTVRIHRLPPSRIPCACSFNPVLHSYIPYYCSARQRVAPCDEERTHARARTHEHARACAGARAEEEEEEETTEGDGPIIAEEPLNVVGTQHNTQGTLRGTRGVLEGTLQGTRGVLEGYSRVLEGYSAGYSRGTLRGTRGVLEGTQHHTLTLS